MLPYHPLDPEYEDYTYDEELEHVTQPFVPSQHTVSQTLSNISGLENSKKPGQKKKTS